MVWLSSLSRAHSNNRLCHIPTSHQSFRLFTVKWCVQIRHYLTTWVTFFWLGRKIHWTFNVSESSWATFLQDLAKPSQQFGDFLLKIWSRCFAISEIVGKSSSSSVISINPLKLLIKQNFYLAKNFRIDRNLSLVSEEDVRPEVEAAQNPDRYVFFNQVWALKLPSLNYKGPTH